MRVKLTIELDVKVKDTFTTLERQQSSDRGWDFAQMLKTPTDADVQECLEKAFRAMKHDLEYASKFSPIELNGFTVTETALCV